jgi:hypothetical protein
MGSLYSKPKTPSPVTYTAAAAPVAVTTPAPVVTDTPVANTESEKAATLVRQKSSRPETIQTSFRGVLTTGDWIPARKSLLGE